MSTFPPDLEKRLDRGDADWSDDPGLAAQARAHAVLSAALGAGDGPAPSAGFDSELRTRLRDAAREPRPAARLSRSGRWIMILYWTGVGALAWSLGSAVEWTASRPGDPRWLLPLVPLSLLLALDPGAWIRRLRDAVAPLLT